MKSHIVKITNKQSREKLKEMFAWCYINCSKDYSKDSSWGTSWWTERNNTEFHFINSEDAILFKLMF